jgi:pyruvate formate lyase activating enzyme
MADAVTYDESEILSFLQKRQGLLEGVCITGGEPLMHPQIGEFIRKVRALGYAVKLDTNGAYPDHLAALIEEGLLDYVAMDIKNSPDLYGQTAGVPNMTLCKIEESVRFLLTDKVDYEFRTTVVEELHDPSGFARIGQWLQSLDPARKAKRLFIQPYVDRDTVLSSGLHTPTAETLHKMAENAAPFVESVQIRGLE